MSYDQIRNSICAWGPGPKTDTDTYVPNGFARLRNKKTGQVIVVRIWPNEDHPYDKEKWELAGAWRGKQDKVKPDKE
jgi:hypothetical protein